MLQDFRYAVRTLFRSPGFTATAGLTLALGIGATTLMFSIVNAVLWRPLPFPDSDRLLLVFTVRQPQGNQIRASGLDFEDWRARAQSFEALAAHVGTGFTLSGTGDPELVIGQMVTPDFFRVLGADAAIGRTLSAGEFAPGNETRVVLSHGLWRRRYGADPAIVGRTTTINGRPFTVVGVMAPSFSYPDATYQLWAPLTSPRTKDMPPLNRTAHYLQVVGRLKPGVTPERAQSEMAGIAGALATQFAASNQNLSARVVPVKDYSVRDVRAPLYMLLASVALVVLIACGNVTNLLLARASARTREVAVRQALGASRYRLARQFLVESLALYGVGAIGGVALASWGLAGIVALDDVNVPRLAEASIDARVFAATLIVSFVTAVVFGLAPAAQGAVVGPAEALKAGGRSAGATPARQRFRMVVVVAELALAVVLLVGAGLTLRSLARLASVDPGFEADGQLTFGAVMSANRYPSHDEVIAQGQRIADALSAGAGVRAAGATTHLPLSGQNMENGFTVEGYTPRDPNDIPVAGMRGIVGNYFAALGIPLKAGRYFTAADRQGSQPVAIVNETFARTYWPGQDPIGRRLSEYGSNQMRTVVGVIADIHHMGPLAELRPEVDIPYGQLDPDLIKTWFRGLSYVVRSDAPWDTTVSGARAAVAAGDPVMPLIKIRPVAEWASDAIAEPRFRSWLLSGFAALAVALATVGVFGVLAYFVTQRTREIGIRVALGATSQDIVRMIMARGLIVAGVGIGIGLAAAVPLAIWLRTLLFGIEPADPLTLAGVAVGLTIVAALASYLPARRALRIEPVSALKLE
jgi:putative ABC transport system permease protein